MGLMFPLCSLVFAVVLSPPSRASQLSFPSSSVVLFLPSRLALHCTSLFFVLRQSSAIEVEHTRSKKREQT